MLKKNILLTAIALAGSLSLASCGSSNSPTSSNAGNVGSNDTPTSSTSVNTDTPTSSTEGTTGEHSILITYFSATNRTQSIAGYIEDATGGTLVEIDPAVPYTPQDLNYNDSNARCEVERRTNARPEISSTTYSAINLASHDIVFIGFPIWDGGEPMIIRTFIEHYQTELAGKTIYTFSTSASSGGQTAYNSISGRLPDSTVAGFRNFTSSQISSSNVNSWMSDLGLAA